MPWKWYEILPMTQQFQNLDVCTFHTNTSFISVTTPTLLHWKKYYFVHIHQYILHFNNSSYCAALVLNSLPSSKFYLTLIKLAYPRLNLPHPSLITEHVHVTCVTIYKYLPVSILQVPFVLGSVLSQSQALNFLASSKRGKVLIFLQHNLMIYITLYILPLFYCCTIIYIHTVIRCYKHSTY